MVVPFAVFRISSPAVRLYAWKQVRTDYFRVELYMELSPTRGIGSSLWGNRSSRTFTIYVLPPRVHMKLYHVICVSQPITELRDVRLFYCTAEKEVVEATPVPDTSGPPTSIIAAAVVVVLVVVVIAAVVVYVLRRCAAFYKITVCVHSFPVLCSYPPPPLC